MGDCWESGGPEWLFGLGLGAMFVGVVCSVLWFFVLLIPSGVRNATGFAAGVPAPVLQVFAILASVYCVGHALAGDPTWAEMGIGAPIGWSAGLAVGAAGVLLLPGSQPLTSLRWSQLRKVPLYALLPLPLLGLVCFLTGAVSFGLMNYLSHPC